LRSGALSLLANHWRVSSYVQRPERSMPLTTIFGARAGDFSTTAGLTIRGGGIPYSNLALMPTDRMGPPPGASPPMRMIASWSGSNDPTAYKSVARRCALNGELLSDLQQTDRQPSTRPGTVQKARLAVHRRSACSGLKALRNTSAARRQAAKLCYRFGPLTPSARSANLIAGDGTKNDFSAPNKEPPTNQNTT
jgi:hypothetical protein